VQLCNTVELILAVAADSVGVFCHVGPCRGEVVQEFTEVKRDPEVDSVGVCGIGPKRSKNSFLS